MRIEEYTMKKKIVFVLPKPLSYRFGEYQKISEQMDVEIVMGDDNSAEFGTMGDRYKQAFSVQPSRVFSLLGGSLFYQTGTLRRFLSYRYDYFFIQGNIRYLDFWIILLINLLLNRPLLVHGQGIYKKGAAPSALSRAIYWLLAAAPMKYVAYCAFSKESLVNIGVKPDKITVFKNTLKVVSEARAVVKRNEGEDLGILFVGRVRHGSGLEWLLSNLNKASNTEGLVFHIVGGGAQHAELVKRFGSYNVRFYGPIFDEVEIAEIARKCSLGIYPGNAGLSLLHYAALGLPPVFHDRLELHEGPEFSFFTPELDSFSFEHGNVDSLLSVVHKLHRNQDLLFDAAKNALNTYQVLQRTGFAEDLLDELL